MPSHQELYTPAKMERYREIESVGEGTYGVVVKSIHKATGTLVAIKEFKEAKDKERVKRTAARELHVLRTLHHPNLVSFLESFHARGQLHLVFELMDRSLLADLEAFPEGLPAAAVESNMLQLVLAVQFMHDNQVMHRDLKPENMLLSKEGVMKLCDFGFARHLEGPGAIYSDYVATRWYRAPELLLGLHQYTSSVDIWALGCLLVEMATGIPLFAGETDIDQLGLIMATVGRLCKEHMRVIHNHQTLRKMSWNCQPQLTSSLECKFPMLTPSQLQFVKACIHPDPARRPTCAQLLQSPFLRKAAANMPASITAAQAASQQSIAAFAAQTKAMPVLTHGKPHSLHVPLATQLSDLPTQSPRIGAQHTSMPSWEPFLSPTAPPFHPRRHFRDAADANAVPRQASESCMPSSGHYEGRNVQPGKNAGFKHVHADKDRAAVQRDCLQSGGSGYNSSASTVTEGSGTPRGSKRSLLPELMLPDAKSAYFSQSDSPSKKSRLHKDTFSHSPHISGHRSDPFLETSNPPFHQLDPAGHSPDASAVSTSLGQENSQHNSNASALNAESAMHRNVSHCAQSLQGFTHTTKAQHHQGLMGAESIVSRSPQHSMQRGTVRDATALNDPALLYQQAHDSAWHLAVHDAQQYVVHNSAAFTDDRAGQYAAHALETAQQATGTALNEGQRAATALLMGQNGVTALQRGRSPVPYQHTLASSPRGDGLSGLRFWEHPEYHTGTGSWHPSQDQQQPHLQQQRPPMSPPRQNIVFGDFSAADLQAMQLSQQPDRAAFDDSTVGAEAVGTTAAVQSNDAQEIGTNQSWWQSLLGGISNEESNTQHAAASSFDLPRQMSEWSEMLLPGVMFAADWASQQDAQGPQGAHLLDNRPPRDLLERRQYAAAKQKLA